MIKLPSTTHFIIIKLFILIIFIKSCPADASGWSDHPVLAKAALSDLYIWNNIDSVEAKTLTTFLLETGHDLENFLFELELRFRSELKAYPARPDEITFIMHEDTSDILIRFFNAIRINPTVNLGLFLYLMPGEDYGERPVAMQDEISLLQIENIYFPPKYVWINDGELVHPLDVLATANDEPDYGFDVGLFNDNNTWFGQIYGFGRQPFGNPKIYHTSQVPFHMGFYHESPIVYLFAPYLQRDLLGYRTLMFKELAIFAFDQGQHYWGWRFLGWSMHYASDATMPYHSSPLPGYSLIELIWMKIKYLLGFPQSFHNAVQMVSNKHIAIEEYQAQEIFMAYKNGEINHPFMLALRNPGNHFQYSHNTLRNSISLHATEHSEVFDNAILKNMPAKFTSDPDIEISNFRQHVPVTKLIMQEKGEESLYELNHAIAVHLQQFSLVLRSMLFIVFPESEPDESHDVPRKIILAGAGTNPKHPDQLKE